MRSDKETSGGGEGLVPVKMFRLQLSVKSTCLLRPQTYFLLLCLLTPFSSSVSSVGTYLLFIGVFFFVFFFTLHPWHFIYSSSYHEFTTQAASHCRGSIHFNHGPGTAFNKAYFVSGTSKNFT